MISKNGPVPVKKPVKKQIFRNYITRLGSPHGLKKFIARAQRVQFKKTSSIYSELSKRPFNVNIIERDTITNHGEFANWESPN